MKKRSNIRVMLELLAMAKPLRGTMFLAVILGVLGNLCAIAIPVLGCYALVGKTGKNLVLLLPVLAIGRGVFHYLEQNRNHYLAFKLLALIRDKVFGALRRLAPAKMEEKGKGDLIAILTADIELLEVFYAHTISPICIALFVSVIMIVLLGSFHPLFMVIALLSYLIVGGLVPLVASKGSRNYGEGFRMEFGELDTFILDSLRGVGESIQYGDGEHRLALFYSHSDALSQKEKQLKGVAGSNSAMTSLVILLLDLIMLLSSLKLSLSGAIAFSEAVIGVVALMSSFGPTLALANLGTGLQNTFAASNRVLDILEDTPVVKENTTGKDIVFNGAVCKDVSFSYQKERILENLSLDIRKNVILGVTGKSGCGKSTLLKLLMRFWDIDNGDILISDSSISEIRTESLREAESFVSQETQLFHDSILRNLLIANPKATMEQVVEASKRASVHDFIMSLPNGYETKVGELGETLSGGERQRLGIARAFLHDAPLILLDEPTSNLDSLNEAVILKSLSDYRKDKTMVLVSHRESTMRIADVVYSVENGRMS